MSSFFQLATRSKRSMEGKKKSKMPKLQEKLENTYRMEPARKFNPGRAEAILKQILNKHLNGKTYDPIKQPRLTKAMTDEIRSRMKGLHYQRYRYVVYLTVGQKQNQGLRVASRCLWDKDRDTFATASFESNLDLFAVATVYAVNYE